MNTKLHLTQNDGLTDIIPHSNPPIYSIKKFLIKIPKLSVLLHANISTYLLLKIIDKVGEDEYVHTAAPT